MTPDEVERVFGRSRLKMATGEHVEVFREAAAPGERRRYTKRFLATADGDFAQWTEREWRILSRLFGHGVGSVPEVVRFDRGAPGRPPFVQTYDAGVTVDQWASLLAVQRGDAVFAHVFVDTAHWWALAHHCLLALRDIHRLHLVHLDVKADNVCVPYAPADFVPGASDALKPVFTRLALIDFAFSVVSGEGVALPLPIGWQKDYDYQSPRLLHALEAGRAGNLEPTKALDWRCDLYSVAAMLGRYLSDVGRSPAASERAGWDTMRYRDAEAFVQRIRDSHDREPTDRMPHEALLETSGAQLADPICARSLARGWTLAEEAGPAAAVSRPTPVTRIAPPLIVERNEPTRNAEWLEIDVDPDAVPAPQGQTVSGRRSNLRRWLFPAAIVALFAIGASLLAFGRWGADEVRAVAGTMQQAFDRLRPSAAPERAPAPRVPPVANRNTDPRSGQRQPPPDANAAERKNPAPALPPRADARPEPPGRPEPPSADKTPAKPSLPKGAEDESAPGMAARASDLLTTLIPRVATQAEHEFRTVLSAAADAEDDNADRAVVDAALRARVVQNVALARTGAMDVARRLNDKARDAFWERRNVQEAFDLQLGALGAYAHDAEIVGNLAFYALKLNPPLPELARQLALFALAVRGPQHRTGRIEDWTTLAIASAMTGRERDARNAFFVTLAIAKDLDRACRAALNAYGSYGERIRAPAEAMLQRIHRRGRDRGLPHCAWPPNWNAGTRSP